VTAHLVLQCCFVLIVCWFVFKTVFVCWLLAAAIMEKGSLVLKLDLNDKDKRCGCGVLDRAWTHMIASLCLFFLMGASSLIANGTKGSMRVPGLDAAVPVIMGQGAVRYAPLAAVLLIFLYFGALYFFLDRQIEAVIDKDPTIDLTLAGDQQLFLTDKAVKAAISMISTAILPVVPGFPSLFQGAWEKWLQ
jgi:hypothetical protein